MHQELINKINAKSAKLGVIGLGYVGLPAACLFAEAGFKVTGVDVKADRVATINAGQSPIEGEEPGLAELLEKVVKSGAFQATTAYANIADADIVLIVVDTPVDHDTHLPHYDAMKAACGSLGKVMKQDVLIVVESTISPGTVQNIITPILEETSDKRVNVDFYLGACPERVMPGKLISNLRNLSRVCGGSTPETAHVMLALYHNIVRADLDETDVVTAELVKTTENSYRDVQIAFANEVAQICEKLGANVWRVRELVNKSPGRTMLMPGAGVGGHCIPKDPWLLAASVGDSVDLQLIPAARHTNDQMPVYVASLLTRALEEAGKPVPGARVAVLGYAYLEESDDTRNSPSATLVEQLESLHLDYVIHDPWVPQYMGDLIGAVAGCDAVVIMVRHQAYREMDLDALKAALRTPILVDGRNAVEPERAIAHGFVYYGVGRGDVEKLQGRSRLSATIHKGENGVTYIHPSSLIEEGVTIGEGSSLWHLVHVRCGAKIGSECVIGRGVFIDGGVEIGSRVKIQNYVSVYHGVTIDDGVFVGPHVVFTNDKLPRAINPDGTLKSGDDWTVVPTHVGMGAAIGANSVLVCGITVGKWAMIGSGSVVTKDVPAYGLVVGNPAHLIGYVDPRGQRIDAPPNEE